jgi:hypothetical protein
MMRHPFHGIVGPDTNSKTLSSAQTEVPARSIGRRSFFGQALAAVVGVGAFFFTRSATAQTGWDAGGGIGFPEGGALQGGYGGGITTPGSGGTVTTFALGEEGGGYPPPRWPPPGRVTTYALGEEGGYYYRRPRYPRYPRYTTYALGEEGGGFNYRRW